MPLFPFICKVLSLPGIGVLNSMCNWQSPKYSFVRIEPEPGTTTIVPSFIAHFADPPSFPAASHFVRSFPSNRMIASEGALVPTPGVTFGGTG